MNLAQDKLGSEYGDRILAPLGQGGMAQIKLAVRFGPKGFRKLYVIKRLRRDIANDEYAAMFMHEARLAALLSHPNVVQSHEVNQQIDDCYLKMEYLDGQALAKLVRRVTRKQLPLELHLYILTELLAGLHYAHELNDLHGNPLKVVHRDVSPGNVFLTYDGQVKLLDFGIALSTEADEDPADGIIKGKVKYMSPEQARGDVVDRRSDLYSVGIMLWEAIACGPFVAKGQAAETTLEQRRRGRYTPVQKLVSGTPEKLLSICEKALSLDPKDRFQSAEEFRETLLDFLSTMPLRPSREKVGEVLSRLFKEERAKLDALISERISSGGEELESPLLPEEGTSRTGTAANSAPPQLGTPGDATPKKSLGATSLMVGALCFIGMAAATVYVVYPKLVKKDETAQRAAKSPSPPAPAPAPAPKSPVKGKAVHKPVPAPAPAPDSAPAPSLVELKVSSVPPEAKISLNGKPMGTGAIKHQLAASKEEQTLVVEHPGYQTIQRTLKLDQNTELEIKLVPLQPEKSAKTTKPTKKSKTPQKRRRSKSTRRAKTPPASSPPASSESDRANGEGSRFRRSSGKRQRKIERKNPYS